MKKSFLICSLLIIIGLNAGAQNIFQIACRGSVDQLDSLLENESLKVEDNRGRSMLHWSVGCNNQETFEYLVEKGIDINEEDDEQNTAMYVAVQFNRDTLFQKLYELQPDKSWTEKYGPSMMEIAVIRQHKEFIPLLVEYGVNVDHPNKRGSTPLEISKRMGSDDIYNLLISLGADESKIRNIMLSGDYLGQDLPGTTSKLFAPNFISTEESEFGSIFSAEGKEFFYGVDVYGKNEIRYTKQVNGTWTKPKVIISHEKYGYNDPFLSPDEKRLYFISNRALDGLGDKKDIDIWYVEKESNGWSEPINAGPNINSKRNEYYISFTNDGTMYFSSNIAAPENREDDYDIYSAKYVNGEFQKAVVLGSAVNTEDYEADVFVAPDESYLIYCAQRETGYGLGDLYISFKDSNNEWTTAVNMGNKVNTQNYEYCPFVTADGKYLMYTSNQDIFWISMDVIEELRP